MVTPEETAVPTSVRELAGKALAHCEQASDTHWRMATEAEAALMLGNRGEARARYAMAIIRTRSTRDIDSMYAQAVLVAGRVFGEAGARDIDALFNYRD
jgi:hypothetical protein